MNPTKWRVTFGARNKPWGKERVAPYHIVADEYRAKALCGVDLWVSGCQIEGEGLPGLAMCNRCLAARSKSRKRAMDKR